MSATHAVHPDTPRAAPWRSSPIRRETAWIALIAGLLHTTVLASGVPVASRVVWVRGGWVYLVAPDSNATAVGSRLSFLVRGKTVAAGEVTDVLDRTLVRVHLTSGEIRDTRHLDRLAVLAEAPLPASRIRVGYPAPGRGADPWPCPGRTIAVNRGTHRVETAGRLTTVVRLPGAPMETPWPDTLVVQQFDDAADEEIALERGELDVGVFWPGELSAHMREHPSWRDPLTWSPGVLTAAPMPPGSRPAQGPDASLLGELNQSVFRGDLRALWASATADSLAASTSRPLTVQYEVASDCPGREAIERFLAARRPGVRPSASSSEGAAVVRLSYRATPVPSGASDLDACLAFECRVVAAPGIRSQVAAIGARRFVELFQCRAESGR